MWTLGLVYAYNATLQSNPLISTIKAQNARDLHMQRQRNIAEVKDKAIRLRREEERRHKKYHAYKRGKESKSTMIYAATLQWETNRLDDAESVLRQNEKRERAMLRRLRASKIMQQEAKNTLS